jgi:hypothetical protein
LQPEGHRFDPGILHSIRIINDFLNRAVVRFHPNQKAFFDILEVKFISIFFFISLKNPFRQFIICHDAKDFRSSYKGHTVDALAREGDEGRGKLR